MRTPAEVIYDKTTIQTTPTHASDFNLGIGATSYKLMKQKSLDETCLSMSKY